MDRKIALIGSGNAFFRDEGAGLYAVKFLKENYDFSPEIAMVDGGTLGFGLMPLLLEHSEVVIVNTASEAPEGAGSVTVKSAGEFLEGSRIKKTANEVEIAEMLQICSLREAVARTEIVSIVPEDLLSVEVGLTEAVLAAWPAYIDAILQTLRQCGVEAIARKEQVPLSTIVQTFADPSIEHGRGF